MNIEKLKREYDRRGRTLQELAEAARLGLQQGIQRRKIKVHSLHHRIKPLDSFLDKARRKGVQNPFCQITDLVGVRVVCLFKSDVDKVLAIIRESFDVVEVDDKREIDEKRAFDYMAVHVVAKLKSDRAARDRTNFQATPFEVQVRTIGQDAWACLSHHLEYKKTPGLPADDLRDLYALSALFHLADTHFEYLKRARP